jgi:dienelactone hydrolase
MTDTPIPEGAASVCYEADAVPPIYGAPLTSTASSQVTLISTDGAEVAAFLSTPDEPSGPAVLVLPDMRGLFGFYEELTVRLAEQGLPALAVDYYSRTAGVDYRARPTDFSDEPNLLPHRAALTAQGLYGDFAAAIDFLRSPDAGGHASVISLGFCVGGRFAFLTADKQFALAGAIGLYGYPDALRGAPGPTQRAADLSAPILGLFAGADNITPEVVDAFDGALTEAGNEHEFFSYPGMPHGFFETGEGQYVEECADVWRRVLAFARSRAV